MPPRPEKASIKMNPNKATPIAITAIRAYLSLIFWITDINWWCSNLKDGENRAISFIHKMWKTALMPNFGGFYRKVEDENLKIRGFTYLYIYVSRHFHIFTFA